MRLISVFAAVFVAAVAALPAVAAPVFDTPDTLIAYAYQPYVDESFPDDPFELYAPSLRTLVDENIAAAGEDEVGALSFDPFIDAQDYDEVNATLDAVSISGDHAEVKVSVSNFGTVIEMEFILINTEKGWLIEDIVRPSGDNPWRLSELLAADPLLN